MNSPATATAPRPGRRPAARPVRPVEVVPRPRLRVVEAPSRRRGRPAAVVGLAVAVVFGALLAAAIVHSLLVSGQARLDDVSAQARVERQDLEREQVRLASLQSPQRITREAERLGMVPGEGDNWIQGDPSAGTDPAPADAPTTDQRTDAPDRWPGTSGAEVAVAGEAVAP